MAIYHCSVKTISRSSGQSIIAAAAYRHACTLASSGTVEQFDYGKKKGVLASKIIVPKGAEVPSWVFDREELWNAAEAAETRKNSRLGREVVIALPAELSHGEMETLVEEFSSWIAGRYGVVVDAAIHEPGNKGDARNWHAHLLLTSRRITKEGFGEKTRELDDKKRGPEEVESIRAAWETLANGALLRAGRGERQIDHRSYEAQGKNRVPTVHLGHTAAALERAGIATRLGDCNREAEAANVAICRQEIEEDNLRQEENLLVELDESARLHAEMVAARKKAEKVDSDLRLKEQELADVQSQYATLVESSKLHDQKVESLGFLERLNPFTIRNINDEADELAQKIEKINQELERLMKIISELKEMAKTAWKRWEEARQAYSESILYQYASCRKDARAAMEELYGESICKLVCPNAPGSATSHKEYYEYLERLLDADMPERSRMISELRFAEKRYEVQKIFYELATYVSRDTSITGRQRLADEWLKKWDSADPDRRDEMVDTAKQRIAAYQNNRLEKYRGYCR